MTPELLGIENNLLLFGMLYRMNAVEQVGSGVRRIREICRDYRVAEPDYEISEHWVTLSFQRPKLVNGVRVEKEEGLADGLGNQLGNTKDSILHEMKSNPHITGKQLSDILKISTTAVEKNIKQLREAGMIKRVGGTRGHWEMLK